MNSMVRDRLECENLPSFTLLYSRADKMIIKLIWAQYRAYLLRSLALDKNTFPRQGSAMISMVRERLECENLPSLT